MRASAAVATGNQVTRGFHAECTSCTSCCPPWRTQASHPGPTGSTSYSVGKAALAARSARAGPRHTPSSFPSHRRGSKLCSEKAAGAASSLAARAASDDAVHAALVLRREAAGCWCTHANGRGRNSVDDEATSAAWWRRSGVSWSVTARDLRQVTGLTGFVGTGNDYAWCRNSRC